MKYNIVDGHCDTPMELYLRQEDLQDNTCQVSLSRAQTLAGYVQFYAFCTVWLDKRTSFEQHYEAALSYFDRQLDKHAGSIVRCRTEADARAAIAGGKCGAFLSIEGAEAISCDPGKLELAYEQKKPSGICAISRKSRLSQVTPIPAPSAGMCEI